jgi:poly(3-hydroxybutyrate) depolymerase
MSFARTSACIVSCVAAFACSSSGMGTGGQQPAGTGASGAPAGATAAAGSSGSLSSGGVGAAGAGVAAAGGGGAAGNGASPAAVGGSAAGGATANGGAGAPSVAGAAAGGASAANGGAGAGAGAGAATAGAGGSTASEVRSPDPKFLVAATGPCPEFRDGYAMFAPDGVQRRVLLYTSGKSDQHGPLIISWHSTLPNPEDATAWIGQSVIDQIKAAGGVVAAPATGYPTATRPWDNTPMGAQNTDGDQRLMDEIVACATTKVGIDVRRIYATGMSAGGLKTAQVSLRRSGYLASVVVYSGGFTEGDMPPDQDPTNPVAAMIFYGGPTDISPVDGINYTQASNRYLDSMTRRGSFAFLCNHGGGHSVPSDSQASAWRFMQDHPFGTKPSPYAMQLPSGFLRYCALPK